MYYSVIRESVLTEMLDVYLSTVVWLYQLQLMIIAILACDYIALHPNSCIKRKLAGTLLFSCRIRKISCCASVACLANKLASSSANLTFSSRISAASSLLCCK